MSLNVIDYFDIFIVHGAIAYLKGRPRDIDSANLTDSNKRLWLKGWDCAAFIEKKDDVLVMDQAAAEPGERVTAEKFFAPKPCEISCEKCGSESISRKFIPVNGPYNQLEHADVNRLKELGFVKAVTALFTIRVSPVEDFIWNHCQSCQFEWGTKPLPPRKKT